jgi:CheY-like chemotaxis protein
MSRPIRSPISRGRAPSCRPRRRCAWPRGSLRLVTSGSQGAIRPTALVAHDSPRTRNIIAAGLVRRGYDTARCQNGREALDQLSATDFDLVVTAIVMPEMDGLELITALKRRAPAIAVVDQAHPLAGIYRRGAALLGAASTHVLPRDTAALLDSADWIVHGRWDVIRDVVW